MCPTSRLQLQCNQEITNETRVAEWKAVLTQTRKSLYNSYENQSYRELMNMHESICKYKSAKNRLLAVGKIKQLERSF